jgi:hypothetical protein
MSIWRHQEAWVSKCAWRTCAWWHTLQLCSAYVGAVVHIAMSTSFPASHKLHSSRQSHTLLMIQSASIHVMHDTCMLGSAYSRRWPSTSGASAPLRALGSASPMSSAACFALPAALASSATGLPAAAAAAEGRSEAASAGLDTCSVKEMQ